MRVWYLSKLLSFKKPSKRRRLPTIIKRPLREWKSFGFAFMCSVNSRMRAVRTATWTSGEPVSPSCVLYSAIIACFFSGAIMINSPSEPTTLVKFSTNSGKSMAHPCQRMRNYTTLAVVLQVWLLNNKFIQATRYFFAISSHILIVFSTLLARFLARF